MSIQYGRYNATLHAIILNRLIVLSFLLRKQLWKVNDESFYRQTRRTSLTTFRERGFLSRTKFDGPGSDYDYGGSGSGGFSIGAHVGARYFVKENIAVGIEAGGASVLSGGTLGAAFIL